MKLLQKQDNFAMVYWQGHLCGFVPRAGMFLAPPVDSTWTILGIFYSDTCVNCNIEKHEQE